MDKHSKQRNIERKILKGRKLKRYLENCNFEMAKGEFINLFSGGVIPKDLAQILDEFVKNPCKDTAIELIKYDSKFMAVFELSRKGGFTEFLFSKGDIKFKKVEKGE